LEFAKQYESPFIETSVLKNINVDEIFMILTKEILNKENGAEEENNNR
jgi:hypothetical protein